MPQMSRSISEIVMTGPAIDIGQFRLVNFAEGKFWLTNADGEGMETSEAKIEAMLKEFFEREF